MLRLAADDYMAQVLLCPERLAKLRVQRGVDDQDFGPALGEKIIRNRLCGVRCLRNRHLSDLDHSEVRRPRTLANPEEATTPFVFPVPERAQPVSGAVHLLGDVGITASLIPQTTAVRAPRPSRIWRWLKMIDEIQLLRDLKTSRGNGM